VAIVPFSSTLTIPAGTTLTAPAEQELNVVPGRVVLLRIIVPPGPRGEVDLWLLHQRSQLAPAAPGRWHALDDDILEWPLQYDVGPGETQFHLCGTSPDANFSHGITFELLVDASTPAPETRSPSSLWGKLSNILSQ